MRFSNQVDTSFSYDTALLVSRSSIEIKRDYRFGEAILDRAVSDNSAQILLDAAGPELFGHIVTELGNLQRDAALAQ